MSTRKTFARTLGAALACTAVSILALAPQAVTAKPKPLPLPSGSSGGGGGGGGGEEGDGKCKQCDDEFTEKASKCMGTYDECQAPCPACKTLANCEARKPCMAPCNVKFAKCKDDAFKERQECEKGCK